MKKRALGTRHAFEKFGYTPSDDARIRIERLERRLEPAVPFPHKHDFFHLLLIEAGSGFHEIDFHRSRIRPRQLFVMKPGQVHSWDLSETTRGFVLEFTSLSFLDEIARSHLLARFSETADCVVIETKADYERLHQTLEFMLAESQAGRPDYEFALRGLLEAAIVQILRLAGQSLPKFKEDPTVAKFELLVESNFRKESEVHFYAKALGLSPRALSMKLARTIQKSPSQVLNERRLLEAKRLLSYSPLGIAEIGYAVGFEDPNYFSRFFKKHAGLTPAQFRAKT